MGDIQVGDFVTTPDNKRAKVLNTYYHENKDVYEFITESGNIVRSCSEHLWKVSTRKHKCKSQIEVIDTSEIIKKIDQGYTVKLPVCEAIGSEDDYELPIDPYVLGILISEGGLTTGQAIFTNTDKEVVDRVGEWVSSVGYDLKSSNESHTYRIVRKGKEVVINEKGQFCSTNIVNTSLKELGLSGKNCFNKFIPSDYLNKASINQRFELLKGLMDGDGTVSKSFCCEYSTSSEQLKNDICYLVRSLGGVARVSSRIPKYSYKGEKLEGALSYRIYIKLRNTSDMFYLTRKKNSCGNRKSELQDKIVSYKYVGKEDVKCIYIDSEDHLYLTDNFVVTHNTYMGLMRFLLYVDDPNFFGYVFRLNATDMKGGGGLFQTACRMFQAYDSRVKYTKQPMCIYFPSGATINFTGIDGEAGLESIRGIEISAAMIDEGSQHDEDTVFWIISRLRTKAKMIPNIWITCNPDPDSFLCKWLEDYYLYPRNTYVDGELVEGRPNPETDGDLRWFLRIGNTVVWGNSKEELVEKYGADFPIDRRSGLTTCQPRSFRFISATCHDNPPLLESDPNYVSNLLNLPRVEKERLYFGNWFARQSASGYFKREWVEVVDKIDAKVKKRVRCWDIAATMPSEKNPHPDFTASTMMSLCDDGYYYIEHAIRDQLRINDVIDWIITTAIEDSQYCNSIVHTYIPQDPNAQAKYTTQQWVNKAAQSGVALKVSKNVTTKSKLTKFLPFAAVAEAGLVRIVRGEWNAMLLDEMESFTGERSTAKIKDDLVDNVSDCFSKLATNKELPMLSVSAIRM